MSATGVITINTVNLLISFGFILVTGLISIMYSLKLEKDILIGSFRMVIQLTAMGYLLKIVFGLQSLLFVLIISFCMILFAVQIVLSIVKKQKVSYFFPTLISIQITFFLITYIVVDIIINANSWWYPQYFIPIGGMIAGNSMNMLAISLDRFFSDLKIKKNEVEMMLLLGATSNESINNIFKASLKAGMIPSINQLMGAGLVTIPGMMTGQILSGTPPTEAVKYQIVVMLMMIASTAISGFIALKLVSKKCFGVKGNLII